MIIDSNGHVPRYIISDDRLIHQGTGCYVLLYERSDEYLRAAMRRLKSLLYASGYSAGEIRRSVFVGSYPIK